MLRRIFKKEPIYGFYLSFVIILLMLIQMVVAYYFFNAQLEENFNNTKATYIQSQMASDNALFYNVHSMVAMLENDAAIIRMLNEDISITEAMETISYVGRVIEYNRTMKGISVYNEQQDMLYTSRSERLQTMSISGEMLRNELGRSSTERKQILCETYTDTDLLHSGIHNNMYYIRSSRKNNSAILIEIDYNELKRQYLGWQELIKGKLIVCTKSGDVVFGGDYKLGENISDSILLNFDKVGETETINENGVKSVVSRYYSEKSNLMYIAVTPVKNLKFSDTASGLFIFIVISICLSIMGIILMCILSKKFNLLLIKMKQKITNSGDNDKNTKLMDYIEYYITGMGRETDKDEIKKLLPEDIDGGTKIVILSVAMECDAEMREIAEYAVDNIIKGLFEENRQGIYILQKRENGMKYIIKTDSGTKVTELCEICMVKIKEQTGISTFYAQSDCIVAEDIISCYKQVCEVEKYRYMYGNDSVLTTEVIKSENSELLRETKEICANIRISTKSMGECEAMIDELFEKLCEMNINEVYDVLWELVIAIHDMIRSINSIRNTDITFNAVDVLKVIETSATAEEVRAYTKCMVSSIEEKLSSMQTNKVNILMEKCKTIIEEKFADSGTCLENIADELGVSANYLGRKFKQVTGLSIADTINGIRMKEAEKLIAGTDESIKNIAEKVGFVDSNYFSVIFRKVYGVPPTVYRRNKRK